MKFSLLHALLTALVLLAGCTLHLEGDIYTRDISDALSGETLSAVIRIDVPIPSNDLCLEYRQQYDALFDRSEDFDDMEFVKCFQRNWNEFYAQYELPAPIIVTDKMMVDVPIQFVLSDTNLSPMMMFGKGTTVRIVADLDSFVSLNELVMSEFFASFDLLNHPPVFYLRNDSRESIHYVAFSSWINGAPVPYIEQFELEPRDTLEIRLSDVATANLFYPSDSGLGFAETAWLGVLLEKPLPDWILP